MCTYGIWLYVAVLCHICLHIYIYIGALEEPFDIIQEILESELGCSLPDVFQHFDHLPVAAASIAQVHLAELRDGTKVAVKVQFPDVERFFSMDVATVSFALQLIGMGGQVKEIFATMQAWERGLDVSLYEVIRIEPDSMIYIYILCIL